MTRRTGLPSSQRVGDDARQGSFLQALEDGPPHAPAPPPPTRREAASLNIQFKLRAALSHAIKQSPLSRAQIAAQMADLLFGDAIGEEGDVTASMLNKWTAPGSDAWRFPAEYLPAFCLVTQNAAPLALLSECTGYGLTRGEAAARAELRALLASQDQLSARIEELKKALTPDQARVVEGGR